MAGDEGTVLAQLRMIEADIRAGRLQQAAAALNALGAMWPRDPRIYITGAMLARASGNASGEVLSLQRAVAIASREPGVHVAMAKALVRGKRFAEAVTAVNFAAELAPEDITTLEIAVAIANAAGDDATALRHLARAHVQWPADRRVGMAFASALTKQGRYAEAEVHWRAALADDGDDPFALLWLGVCLVELDRKLEALAVLERAEAKSPGNETLRFYAAIARGETPPKQPEWIPQAIFDKHAEHFDVQLVGQLKYRVPRRVAEILLARDAGRNISVLDLGCGTGLLGAYLGPVNGRFVGVDLSVRMIERAARHGVYDELRQGELLAELLRTAPDSFDFVIANDVFVYVGDLSAVIAGSFRAIRKGGALVFSCELADESEGALVLRQSKRYAHSRGSVEALCRDAGFSHFVFEPIEVRLEANVPVAGFVAVAEKS